MPLHWCRINHWLSGQSPPPKKLLFLQWADWNWALCVPAVLPYICRLQLQNAFRSTVSSPKDKLLLKGHDLYACWNVSLAWSGLFTVWKISCTTTQWHYSMVSYYIFSHISVSRDNGSLFVTYVSPAEMNYGDRGGWAQAGQKTVALPELQFWSLSSGMPPPGLSERVRPCPSNQHWYPLSN